MSWQKEGETTGGPDEAGLVLGDLAGAIELVLWVSTPNHLQKHTFTVNHESYSTHILHAYKKGVLSNL